MQFIRKMQERYKVTAVTVEVLNKLLNTGNVVH